MSICTYFQWHEVLISIGMWYMIYCAIVPSCYCVYILRWYLMKFLLLVFKFLISHWFHVRDSLLWKRIVQCMLNVICDVSQTMCLIFTTGVAVLWLQNQECIFQGPGYNIHTLHLWGWLWISEIKTTGGLYLFSKTVHGLVKWREQYLHGYYQLK